jgi:hypothetical protein
VSDGAVFGRLLNGEGELIAEGPCYLDEAAGQATLEPQRSPGEVQKERGPLALELDSGRSLRVSDRPMMIQYRPPGTGPGEPGRRRIIRLRLLPFTGELAQEADAAGAVGEGSPAAPVWGRPRFDGETPAAR